MSAFSDEFAVVCPGCAQKATVYASGPRVMCGRCGRIRSAEVAGWQGSAHAEIKKHCSWCGEYFSKSFEQCAPRPSTIEEPCPNCEAVYIFELYWKPVGQASGSDPYFGYDLWYKMSCAGNVLWALNDRHLQFLRSYVGATLRTREPGRNASLASMLPGWLISAKNRAEVLKCLDRLAAKGSI